MKRLGRLLAVAFLLSVLVYDLKVLHTCSLAGVITLGLIAILIEYIDVKTKSLRMGQGK